MTDYPWLPVTGFGAHIKATRRELIIQKKSGTQVYPIDSIHHLLIIGGHSLNSATITHLIRQGVSVTFFEPDGNPVGTIQPSGPSRSNELTLLQQTIPRHRFAVAIAEGALRSRLRIITQEQEADNKNLFYEGELELLTKSYDELAYLIKLDEIRRLHRMASDMYYEIMSRSIPSEFGFRRRTLRPHTDPVNAMISFGYSLLYGACSAPVVGAFLDPDSGTLHTGAKSLVYDLIEPLKADMIDRIVFPICRETLNPVQYELTESRCILSEELIRDLIGKFYRSIDMEKVNHIVWEFCKSLNDPTEFRVMY